MHFKITGTEHATSARRVIELEAPNRAAAEKQAHQQGVDEILHVEQLAEDPAQAALDRAPRVTHRGEWPEESAGRRWILIGTVVLLLILAAWWFWWPRN